MTKTLVQLFVENLLKLLKLLKTRKRARNGLAELRRRSARQGAKAPFKTKEQNEVLDDCKETCYNITELSRQRINQLENEGKITWM